MPDVRFEIKEHIAVLSNRGSNGWKKSLTSYHGAAAMLSTTFANGTRITPAAIKAQH